ncbi:TetR/AcrR family transcriptional regulator [Thalassoglobus sp. JC818]|uniref:TetR/AcrR family transcriptional regulator n=1 Tax=Thalassoglobus sp. JC818 TaxID=3232136 RepID=UPI0034585522
MSNTRAKKSDARQRIVETAERLFYAEGVRAVGIDRIIAEASVAKMTLYNHFASKDDLILAVLKYRETQFDATFEKSIERHHRKGMDKLEAFFAALKDWFKSSGFRGCSFINARIELADASHPASEFSAEHKERFHEMLKEIVIETAGTQVAATVTPAICLMVEGAIVTAVMEQSPKSADVAKTAAFALVADVTN